MTMLERQLAELLGVRIMLPLAVFCLNSVCTMVDHAGVTSLADFTAVAAVLKAPVCTFNGLVITSINQVFYVF